MATGVRVAVLTPYFKESSEVLDQCHRSVMEQSVPADHVLVADGAARQELDTWTVNHVILPKDCDDGRICNGKEACSPYPLANMKGIPASRSRSATGKLVRSPRFMSRTAIEGDPLAGP